MINFIDCNVFKQHDPLPISYKIVNKSTVEIFLNDEKNAFIIECKKTKKRPNYTHLANPKSALVLTKKLLINNPSTIHNHAHSSTTSSKTVSNSADFLVINKLALPINGQTTKIYALKNKKPRSIDKVTYRNLGEILTAPNLKTNTNKYQNTNKGETCD